SQSSRFRGNDDGVIDRKLRWWQERSRWSTSPAGSRAFCVAERGSAHRDLLGLARMRHDCERMRANLVEQRRLRAAERCTALPFEGELRIARDSIDTNLEVKMRTGCPARHTDVTDGLAHFHVRARMNSTRESAHVSVAAHHAVAVTDVDHVPIATDPCCRYHDAVTDRVHRGSHRGRVVGAGVIAPRSEDRMLAQSEHR